MLAAHFLSQVILDFCLTLLFSMATRPSNLDFRILINYLSDLVSCLISWAFFSLSITSLHMAITILQCDTKFLDQIFKALADLLSLICSAAKGFLLAGIALFQASLTQS
jgi:hypothetical protein